MKVWMILYTTNGIETNWNHAAWWCFQDSCLFSCHILPYCIISSKLFNLVVKAALNLPTFCILHLGQGIQEWTKTTFKRRFLKAVFQKIFLVHSWTTWPIYYIPSNRFWIHIGASDHGRYWTSFGFTNDRKSEEVNTIQKEVIKNPYF